MDKAIRILVANRPKLMRELLLATLSEQNWIEVVGEVAEMSELSDFVAKTSPDLVVIDAEEHEVRAGQGIASRPTYCKHGQH